LPQTSNLLGSDIKCSFNANGCLVQGPGVTVRACTASRPARCNCPKFQSSTISGVTCCVWLVQRPADTTKATWIFRCFGPAASSWPALSSVWPVWWVVSSPAVNGAWPFLALVACGCGGLPHRGFTSSAVSLAVETSADTLHRGFDGCTQLTVTRCHGYAHTRPTPASQLTPGWVPVSTCRGADVVRVVAGHNVLLFWARKCATV
jgi:hypothetical protein